MSDEYAEDFPLEKLNRFLVPSNVEEFRHYWKEIPSTESLSKEEFEALPPSAYDFAQSFMAYMTIGPQFTALLVRHHGGEFTLREAVSVFFNTVMGAFSAGQYGPVCDRSENEMGRVLMEAMNDVSPGSYETLLDLIREARPDL